MADLEAAGAPSLVVSRYQVDCSRQELYATATSAYNDAVAAGTPLTGVEFFYSACVLVTDVDEDAVPLVMAAQHTEASPDWTADTNVWSNNNYVWFDVYSGGYMYGGGVNTYQMAPGMQLRYDPLRRMVYTASDWRGERAPNAPYDVVVVGGRAYTAP